MKKKMSADIHYKKRVLESVNKTEMLAKGQVSFNEERIEGDSKIQVGEGSSRRSQRPRNGQDTQNLEKKGQEMIKDDTDDSQNSDETDTTELERKAYTRCNRVVKKRKENQLDALENKRSKREIRRYDEQKNQEALLDKEVEDINENNRSILNKYENKRESTINIRSFWQGFVGNSESSQDTSDNTSSSSENHLIIAEEHSEESCEEELNRNLSENHVAQQSESMDNLDADCKSVKTPKTSKEGSDEPSTYGESSSNITPKILETPEDTAKKESNLRILSMESPEKAAEGLSHQKAKKEQYTGTSKTVILVPKEKEEDKRPPLKMVLKQGRKDDEVDKPECFYIIQKKFGTSGWGDSSSGANLNFSANYRHSCDEDNEDTAPKDRQSLVIPEKSSSFSIHPGHLCADACCCCFGKFRPLETPMHLAQMKSDERRQRILNIERHLTKDSCLCDACYRHVDRKAHTSPTNMQTNPQKKRRQLMMSNCSVRECRDGARHRVKRQCLHKIKAGLQKQMDIDWESSQQTSMSFCDRHHSIIEQVLTCALCKIQLTRHHIYQLADAETDKLNQLHQEHRIPLILEDGTYVCSMCRYFAHMQLKYKDVAYMNTNYKSFVNSYRERVQYSRDIEDLRNENEDSTQNQTKDKDKDKDNMKKTTCNTQPKAGTSKSPDGTTNSDFEKSTPRAIKNEGPSSETDSDNCTATANLNDEDVDNDVQFLGIVTAAEKLEKEKLLDMHSYTSSDAMISRDKPNEVIEILAMDKEVTLYRLPKRPKTNNDINPNTQILRTLLQSKKEKNLHDNTEIINDPQKAPQDCEKCDTRKQFGRSTELLRHLQQELYGDRSSFSRHRTHLEKYYGPGDFELAPNASRNVINNTTSVQNDLISYEASKKMKTTIAETITSENRNSRLLSGGYVLESDKYSSPSTSTSQQLPSTSSTQSIKSSSPPVLKLNPGVSVMKEPLPNEQQLNLPSTSANSANDNVERNDGQEQPTTSSDKVFESSKAEFKRLQNLEKQEQQMLTDKQSTSSNVGTGNSNTSTNVKSAKWHQRKQMAARSNVQKRQRMRRVRSIETEIPTIIIHVNSIKMVKSTLSHPNKLQKQVFGPRGPFKSQKVVTNCTISTNTENHTEQDRGDSSAHNPST